MNYDLFEGEEKLEENCCVDCVDCLFCVDCKDCNNCCYC